MEQGINSALSWGDSFESREISAAGAPPNLRRWHVSVGTDQGPTVYLYGGDLFGETSPTGALARPYLLVQQDRPAAFQIIGTVFPRTAHDDKRAANAPWATQLTAVREKLGLTISSLADVLHVSRVTLYEWLKGVLPTAANQGRIATLSQVSEAWVALGLGPMTRFWNLPSSTGATLRQVLTAESLSLEAFQHALTTLGLGKRLLPPRASKPVVLDAASRARRGDRNLPAWGVSSDDRD